MENTNLRLWLGGAAVGITLLVLWHRSSLKRESQRAASQERQRIETERAA